MLQATVTYRGTPYACEGAARTHTLTLDVDAAQKGGDTGPTPHEALLIALGSCTAMVIAGYAAAKKWDLTEIEITVTEDKIDDPDDTSEGTKTKIPRIVEDIKVKGELTDEQLAKLKERGEKCPVLQLLLAKKVIESKISRSE